MNDRVIVSPITTPAFQATPPKTGGEPKTKKPIAPRLDKEGWSGGPGWLSDGCRMTGVVERILDVRPGRVRLFFIPLSLPPAEK